MAIVTDKLKAYYHYQQGFTSSQWDNIAPTTSSNYHLQLVGSPTTDANGILFDGATQYGKSNSFNLQADEFTAEFYVRPQTIFDYSTLFDFYFQPDVMMYSSLLPYDTLAQMSYSKVLNDNGSIQVETDSYDQSFTYDSDTLLTCIFKKDKMQIYKNGVLHGEVTGVNTGSTFMRTFFLFIGTFFDGSTYGWFYKGNMKHVKIYEKALSPAEITQNYTAKDSISLSAPSSSPPICSIVSTSKTKISDEVGMKQSIITFKFDKDVTQWVAKLGGSDNTTGTTVDSGTTLTANTNATATVDWNEGLSEGTNRINIYGQASDGTWTAYNS